MLSIGPKINHQLSETEAKKKKKKREKQKMLGENNSLLTLNIFAILSFYAFFNFLIEGKYITFYDQQSTFLEVICQ